MSENNYVEIEERNQEAMKQFIDAINKRVAELETEVATLRNHVQSCTNLVTELTRTNTLALRAVRGTGPTQ